MPALAQQQEQVDFGYKFYLTIRPRGRMDYESIANEAVGRMDYSKS